MNKSPEAFRTISEVADLLQTPAHVLRFWESRFTQIKPVKRAGGRRYYRPADVALLAGIRKLLHDDGMTIRGVQKILREQGVRHVASLTGDPQSAETDEAALDLALAETARAAASVADGGESAEIVALEDALRARAAAQRADEAKEADEALPAEGEGTDSAAAFTGEIVAINIDAPIPEAEPVLDEDTAATTEGGQDEAGADEPQSARDPGDDPAAAFTDEIVAINIDATAPEAEPVRDDGAAAADAGAAEAQPEDQAALPPQAPQPPAPMSPAAKPPASWEDNLFAFDLFDTVEDSATAAPESDEAPVDSIAGSASGAESLETAETEAPVPDSLPADTAAGGVTAADAMDVAPQDEAPQAPEAGLAAELAEAEDFWTDPAPTPQEAGSSALADAPAGSPAPEAEGVGFDEADLDLTAPPPIWPAAAFAGATAGVEESAEEATATEEPPVSPETAEDSSAGMIAGADEEKAAEDLWLTAESAVELHAEAFEAADEGATAEEPALPPDASEEVSAAAAEAVDEAAMAEEPPTSTEATEAFYAEALEAGDEGDEAADSVVEEAAATAESAFQPPAVPPAIPDATAPTDSPALLAGRLRALPRQAFAADPGQAAELAARLVALRARLQAAAPPAGRIG